MAARTTPWDATDQQRRAEQPASELDLMDQVLEPSDADDLLQQVNLGTGNYSDKESWQQVQAFRNHIFADAAFGGTLADYAIYQTIWALGSEAIEDPDDYPIDAETDTDSRRDRVRTLGRRRWGNLGREAVTDEQWAQMGAENRDQQQAMAQLNALHEHVGFDGNWISPFGRMTAVRHEVSRSRGARLIDNIFSRVREFVGDSEAAAEADVRDLGGGAR